MTTRYHINNDGVPGVCHAQPGGCPFASIEDHYDSKEEAQKAYETQMSSQTFATTKKYGHYENGVFVPDKDFQEVEGEHKVDDLLSGDYVLRGKSETPYEIISTNTGYKYVALTVFDKQKNAERVINVPIGESVLSRRMIETPESKAERKTAMLEVGIKSIHEGYNSSRKQVIKELEATVEAGNRIAPSSIENLIKADAKDSIMADYNRELSRAKNLQVKHPYLEAEKELQKIFNEELIISTRVSSSTGQNLYERAILAEKATFIKNGITILY